MPLRISRIMFQSLDISVWSLVDTNINTHQFKFYTLPYPYLFHGGSLLLWSNFNVDYSSLAHLFLSHEGSFLFWSDFSVVHLGLRSSEQKAFSCSCHFQLTLWADLLFWKLVPLIWIHFSLLDLPWYKIDNVLSLSSSAIIYLRLLRTLLYLYCGEFSIFRSHLCTHQLHCFVSSLSFLITSRWQISLSFSISSVPSLLAHLFLSHEGSLSSGPTSSVSHLGLFTCGVRRPSLFYLTRQVGFFLILPYLSAPTSELISYVGHSVRPFDLLLPMDSPW